VVKVTFSYNLTAEFCNIFLYAFNCDGINFLQQ